MSMDWDGEIKKRLRHPLTLAVMQSPTACCIFLRRLSETHVCPYLLDIREANWFFARLCPRHASPGDLRAQPGHIQILLFVVNHDFVDFIVFLLVNAHGFSFVKFMFQCLGF